MGVRRTVFRKSSVLPHKPAKSLGEYSPTYSPSVKMYKKCLLPFIVGGGVGEGGTDEGSPQADAPGRKKSTNQPTKQSGIACGVAGHS